jgi:hypothetical protein
MEDRLLYRVRESGQGVDASASDRRAPHLLDRHRPRRRVARRWKRLTAAERSGQAATDQASVLSPSTQ